MGPLGGSQQPSEFWTPLRTAVLRAVPVPHGLLFTIAIMTITSKFNQFCSRPQALSLPWTERLRNSKWQAD